MTDLRDLYQEVILDHNKRPRNFKPLPGADRTAEGHNPLCGDRVKVYVKLAAGRIAEITFEGTGCAISKASASLMTEALKGKTEEESREIFTRFHRMVAGEPEPGFDPEALGKLAAFQGVREFPVRVKCASLAWHTLQAALASSPQTVSTE
jgi:nitrogen fixation NifU-like protein